MRRLEKQPQIFENITRTKDVGLYRYNTFWTTPYTQCISWGLVVYNKTALFSTTDQWYALSKEEASWLQLAGLDKWTELNIEK